MKRILVVDDEPQVLDGIRKALRPFRKDWSVETAEGGRAGIEKLKAEPFVAIVSDARMPGVDGEQVMKAAREFQPQSVRIVLSGQVERAMGHRLASVAHQFLAKPSEASVILAAIEDSCRVRDTLSTPELRTMVSSLGSLPVSPSTFQRLSELLDSPTTSIDAVVEVVEAAPQVSVTVLRLVSSAFIGLPRKVSTLRDAVVLLGLDVLRQVVLSAEVFREPDTLGLLEVVQERSMVRAQLARIVAERSPVVSLACEAALLADIGAYVIALRRPADYARVWNEYQKGESSLVALEKQQFGSSHCEVGAALLALWSLPPTIVAAVAQHHDVASAIGADARTVVALTSLLEEESMLRGQARTECTAAIDRLGVQLSLGVKLERLRAFAQLLESKKVAA